MTGLLCVVVLLGSGITLGVFFAVAVSVAPALATLPPPQYVQTHRLLGRGYHPAMPIITNVTTVTGILLAIVADEPAAKVLFAAGVLLVIGVQAVSHLGNVPINRSLRGFDGATPPGWVDPRPQWRAWHLLRTALATALLLVNAIAVIAAN
ncbi:DUF1772 domain-containing protein [Actinoplanes sp. NPDC049316]|uniref:anthrone oxygenase family protein n=1 Tax=Actinoplanes sp. NPDC049316 TaxID=3154727 RepID=UPI003423071D